MRLLISFLLIAAMAQAQTWREVNGTIPNWTWGVRTSDDHSVPLDGTISRIGNCDVYTNPEGVTKSIRRIGWRTHLTVNKGGGSGMTIALQDPQAGVGNPLRPDNVDDQTVAVSNAAIPAANTIHETGNLSADRTVTPGDTFCVVHRWDGAGRQGTDVVSISHSPDIFSGASGPSRWIAGAWDSGMNARTPFLYFIHSDGTIGSFMRSAVATQPEATINLNSSPDEVAMRVSAPYGFRATGAWVRYIGGVADFNFVVYDNAGTALRTIFVPAGTLMHESISVSFPPLDVPANTVYRFAIRPSTTTSVPIPHAVFSTAQLMQQPGRGGTAWSMSTRTDLGAWTDFSLQRPIMQIQVSHILEPAGGAGPASFPIQ